MIFLDVTTEVGDPNTFVNSVLQWFTSNGLDAVKKIVVAIILLWLGFKLIKFFKRKLETLFDKRNLDVTLRPVLLSIITIVLKVLLIIAVISYIGIPMTSFVALLGAAGLAVGMALSGTIQNVAGGIIILVFRPFKIGDYIQTQNYDGTVEVIHIFSTVIRTFDNKLITLPNGTLANSNITNHSTKPTRRIAVDLQVASGQAVNLEKIDKDLIALAKQNPLAISSPEPSTMITIGPGSVTIRLVAWCNTDDYWTFLNQMQIAVYNYNLKENLPCPYTVVGMLKS